MKARDLATYLRVVWRFAFCLALIGVMLQAPAGTIITVEHDYSKYGKVWNTAPGICAAAATINSFIYLRNQYPSIYSGTNIIPDWDYNDVIDESDYNTSRDKLAWGWNDKPGIYKCPAGEDGQKWWWKVKNAWLDEFAPGKTVFSGQYLWADSSWTRADRVQKKVPEWSFLLDQLRKCEDIEIGFWPWDSEQKKWGTGHAVTVTGLRLVDCNDNGKWDPNEEFKIFYCDPNDPVAKKEAFVSLGEVDSWQGIMKIHWWQDPGRDYFILNAFSESPIPDAATLFLFSSGLVVVLPLFRRKR